MREEADIQFSIYYVSNTLKNVELRYSRVEKVGCTLLLSVRRLKPYFQAHSLHVMIDLPLEKYLSKLHKFGRILNSGVELGKFSLKYMSQKSMKGKLLADFVVECTILAQEEETPPDSNHLLPWIIHVDGVSNSVGGGAEVVL